MKGARGCLGDCVEESYLLPATIFRRRYKGAAWERFGFGEETTLILKAEALPPFTEMYEFCV